MKTNVLSQDLLPFFQKSKASFLEGRYDAYRKNIQSALEVASSVEWDKEAFASFFIQSALGSHCPPVATLILKSLSNPLKNIEQPHMSIRAPLNKAVLQNIYLRFSSPTSTQDPLESDFDEYSQVFEDEWQALGAFCYEVTEKRIPLPSSMENYLGEVATRWTNWREDASMPNTALPEDLKWYMEWLRYAGADPSSGYKHLQRMVSDNKLQDADPVLKLLQEFCVEAEKGLIVEALEDKIQKTHKREGLSIPARKM